MKVDVQYKGKVLKKLIEQVELAKSKGVYVGIPAEANKPVEEGEAFNLASLAAVLEFGNDKIPSRPFLRQTLEKNKHKYSRFFTDFLKESLDVNQAYEKIALLAQADVQLEIVNGEWVANAKSTIKRKKSSKPLIDTGRLRQSIVGVVRDEK